MSDQPTTTAPAAPALEVPTIVAGTQPVAAPAAPAVEAPTIITPASAPVEMPATEVVAEPVIAEPVAEPAKPTEGAEPAKPEPSLLETAGKPEEKKPEEKPAETKPAEAAADLPAYEAFKLPEGVPLDEKRIDAFKEIIGPHKLDQETAQKLVDLHTETLQAYQAATLQHQIDAFAETRRGWRNASIGDEQIGGAGHQTAMTAAARMRDLLVPDSRREAFAKFLADTGVGDHPEFIRIFHNAARLFDEPAAPSMPARPTADRGGNGKMPRAQQMYDHPTSRRAAGRA